MNLMRLFNKDYFKENLRKSKGVLAFFLGVVPLINILLLIIALLNINGNLALLDFQSLSVITFLGMYILPLVLAASLFGFVFKRKSVDFVMSKPLSRKTIYFTNIIGGLIVLSIFSLLNTLVYLLFGLFAPFVIPFSLIVDYMIFWLVSYIFMFVVSVLAISICGNLISTIVVMFIIICLVPYLNMVSLVFDGINNDTYIKCNDKTCEPVGVYCNTKECKKHLENKEYSLDYRKLPSKNYTAPLMFLNNFDSIAYSLGSIIKMIILSIIYIIIGFYTFNNRKMENNEVSFKNEKIHYLVKIITLLPVSLITYVLIHEATLTGLLVSLTIIFIYSIVYDLLTRKEIYKFVKSTVISLVFFGIFSGGYALYDTIHGTRVLDVDKIEKVSFAYPEFDDKIDIKDKELINEIVSSALTQNGNVYKNMIISVNNNEYEGYVYLSEELNDKLKDLIRDNKLYELKDLKSKDIIYTDELMVDNKLKDLIIETVNKDDFSYTNQNQIIEAYTYANHDYKTYSISKGMNKDLDNYILEKYNIKTNDIIKEAQDKKQNIIFTYLGNNLDSLQVRLFNYVINNNLDSFINYLENKNTDYTSQSAMILIYGNTKRINVPIGDELLFKEEYESYQKKLENDKDYQELILDFKKEIEEENEY